MPIIIAIALCGPTFLIIGLVDTGKDAGSFLTIGIVITLIEILIAICAFISHKKRQAKLDKMTEDERKQFLNKERIEIERQKQTPLNAKTNTDKPASVIKRGVAGTIIGGVPGAIIGAASAIDKNNRNKK